MKQITSLDVFMDAVDALAALAHQIQLAPPDVYVVFCARYIHFLEQRSEIAGKAGGRGRKKTNHE
jgi:hypothetical protein